MTATADAERDRIERALLEAGRGRRRGRPEFWRRWSNPATTGRGPAAAAAPLLGARAGRPEWPDRPGPGPR